MIGTNLVASACRFPREPAPPSTNIGSMGGDLCPNDHSKPKIPTVTAPHLTTMNGEKTNWSRWHPWASPGSTPGLDPCGLAGGAKTNMSMRAGGFGPETGYVRGLSLLRSAVTTNVIYDVEFHTSSYILAYNYYSVSEFGPCDWVRVRTFTSSMKMSFY